MEKINWQNSHGNAPGYEAQHTPTPWKIGERLPSNNTIEIKSFETGSRSALAYVAPRPHYRDDQEANAALIVQAVNAYAQNQEVIKTLIETGKEAAKRYRKLEILYASKTGITYDANNGSIERLEKAIAQGEKSLKETAS